MVLGNVAVPYIAIAWLGLFVFAGMRVGWCKCPRCGNRFHSTRFWHNPWTQKCLHCQTFEGIQGFDIIPVRPRHSRVEIRFFPRPKRMPVDANCDLNCYRGDPVSRFERLAALRPNVAVLQECSKPKAPAPTTCCGSVTTPAKEWPWFQVLDTASRQAPLIRPFSTRRFL